jgi:hypothetical protein
MKIEISEYTLNAIRAYVSDEKGCHESIRDDNGDITPKLLGKWVEGIVSVYLIHSGFDPKRINYEKNRTL